jgi:putative transposase
LLGFGRSGRSKDGPQGITEEQIGFALRQAEAGTAVAEICRKLGVAEATFYRWKQRYAGMGITEIRRLKQLEERTTASSRWWPALGFLTGRFLQHVWPEYSPFRLPLEDE